MSRRSQNILRDATAPTTGEAYSISDFSTGVTDTMSFEVDCTGTAAIAANVSLYGKHPKQNSGGVLLATAVLGNGSVLTDSAGTGSIPAYTCVYAVLNSVSGTDATVNVYIGA
jgi:hypothetical protein